MTDLMQRLTDARPTQTELDMMWPPAARAEALERIRADGARPPRRRRARRAVLVGAAATIGAAVAIPTVISSGDASAHEDLRALATAAVRADAPVIASGAFLHVKTESVQRNSRIFNDGRMLDTNRESWVRWDGKIWAVDSRPSAGWREYHVFPIPDEPDFSQPTPEFAAALPDTPQALGRYLDEHVQGSNSHEEAIFVAVTDLARSNYLPPKTLAAALKVLSEVDGVETRDVTVQGREAVELTFGEWWEGLLGEHSVTLDRATARVITEKDSDPSSTYTSQTMLVEVVDRVPQNVLDAYRGLENGERVYDEPTSNEP